MIFLFTAIKKANKKAISRAANKQKFEILPKDFSMPDEMDLCPCRNTEVKKSTDSATDSRP